MTQTIQTMPTPNNFINSQFGFISNDGAFVSSFSGTIQTVEFAGSFWAGSYTIRPMKSNETLARQWQSFFARLGGRNGRFYAYDPDRTKWVITGASIGTPLVNGANQTGTELIVDGLTANITIHAGNYLEVNDEYKMITQDVVVDGSGNTTLPIFPPLRASPPDNEPIVITNPKGIFMLDSTNIQWQGDMQKVLSISFNFREAFNFDTFLMTEDDDNLVTESGDYILT
jgi:hypothetical protein